MNKSPLPSNAAVLVFVGVVLIASGVACFWRGWRMDGWRGAGLATGGVALICAGIFFTWIRVD